MSPNPLDWAIPLPAIQRGLNRIPGLRSLFTQSALAASQIPFAWPIEGRSGEINVVPLPSSYSTGNLTLCLDPHTFTFDLSGLSHPDDLSRAVEDTRGYLTSLEHTYLSPSHGAEFFEGSQVRSGVCDETVSSLRFVLDGPSSSTIAQEAISPAEERPALDQYRLTVEDGTATLHSGSHLGLFRGLTTFKQLWYKHDTKIYAPFGPYRIVDQPTFGWRSIMIDTSRHYLPLSVIKKQIDAMSFVKLNVLHWHITDSHSWPMDLKEFPDLIKGAYSPKAIYTEEDIKELIRYAAEKRGVDVLLEIDTPGHTASLIDSHPDFIACYDHKFSETANEPPAGQLRFANDTIVTFAVDLFDAVSEVVDSVYVGTGGDEINVNCMMRDEPTTAILNERGWTLDQALSKFTEKTHRSVRKAGKVPTVWQEMVLEHDVTLNDDTIVHIWRASSDAIKVLDRGFRIIHASSDYFYLDCGIGGWIGTNGGGDSWCDPYKSWARMYSFDPYANVNEEQERQVLGGQASLWAEQVDETNLETLIWPRAAALAEVFWTKPDERGYPMNSLEALPRMHDVRYRLVDIGVKAVPLQPQWCALHPGRCNLDS